ncbi:MAG: nucleotidyltransferase domain-containing protein [Acidimicrobiia bacterium]
MNVGRPFADIVPGPRGVVLATLVQLEVPVTVRALARHAAISPQGALRIVNELSAAGVVTTQRAGRALLVELNREHLTAGPLTALVSLRARLVEQLAVELAGWPRLAGAWLFGSTARGDGGPDSDVDVLLVADRSVDGDDWADASGRLSAQVRAWTGNDVQLVEHTRRSFAQLVRRDNPLAAALRAEGIPLTPTTRGLLRGAA